MIATESGLDQEKSASTWVHRHLGLKANCRNFEIKHACYSGTAGLQMALGWIASGLAGDAKALLIATDQSRMHLGQPWEYVLGAGAAAVLISNQPRLFEVELGRSGYWTQEVSDLIRPTSRIEAGDRELSVACYIDALEGAYAHYVERVGEPVSLESYFKKNIYHIPFGGITLLAHRTLLENERSVSKQEARESFDAKSAAALRFPRRMGATYAASPFIALASMIHYSDDLEPGNRIGVFSYGSGSCAEFYSGLLGSQARTFIRGATVPERLDGRRRLSVPEYEAVERERASAIDCEDFEPQLDAWYDQHYAGSGLLAFRGVKGFHRRYEWS
jgi:hydroxymethylglutaryl-CoA synthase